jgi:membrane protein YqaA with SNARE-associated domain
MIVGIAALWALAEATCFVILPDFFLLPAVVARPRLAIRLVLAVLAGSLIGSLALALASRQAPDAVHDFIVALPFTSQEMFEAVAGATDLAAAVLTQPVSGVPAKVWTWTGVNDGVALVPFFAVLMAARLMRFTAVAAVGGLLAATCGTFLRRHARVVLVLYTVVFMGALSVIAGLR